MPYVQRRDGVVCGCYAQRQPGLAEELLAEDHPDVLVYLNPPPDPRLVLDQEERLQAKLDAAVMALVNVTPAQLVTWMVSACRDTSTGPLFAGDQRNSPARNKEGR